MLGTLAYMHIYTCFNTIEIGLLQCALYAGLPLETTQKLLLVQNTAAQMLRRANKSDHITPMPWDLHRFPICFHAEFKVLAMTFKALLHTVWDEGT